jgi:hypothetical protein
MRFTGPKNIFKSHPQLQFEACLGDAIMTSSWQLEVKIKGEKKMRQENKSTQ